MAYSQLQLFFIPIAKLLLITNSCSFKPDMARGAASDRDKADGVLAAAKAALNAQSNPIPSQLRCDPLAPEFFFVKVVIPKRESRELTIAELQSTPSTISQQMNHFSAGGSSEATLFRNPTYETTPHRHPGRRLPPCLRSTSDRCPLVLRCSPVLPIRTLRVRDFRELSLRRRPLPQHRRSE